MNLRYLKIFEAVCTYGSTVKAGEALHIAQPSVSVAINEMEKYYNVILFKKIKQRLVLTDEGKTLLYMAKNTLKSFDEFEAAAHSLIETKKISFGSSISVGTFILPKIIQSINKTLPTLKINAVINQSKKIADGVKSGDFDFGLIESPISSDDLKILPIKQDKLTLICGNRYADIQTVSVPDIAHYRFILREKGSSSRDMLDSVLLMHNVKIEPYIESVSSTAILSLVEHNLGISILPYSLCEKLIQLKKIRALSLENIDFTKNLSLIYHADRKLTDIDRKIIQLILSLDC